MSVEAITWALKQPVQPSSAKFVLTILANCADGKDFICWPSVAYLAAATSQNRKTVEVNLKRLKALGLISDTGERRGLTKQVIVYRLSSPENETPPKTVLLNTPENGTVKHPRNYHLTPPKTGDGTVKEPLNSSSGLKDKSFNLSEELPPPISKNIKKSGFQEFWDECPRTHCAKQVAEKAYHRARAGGVSEEVLLDGMRRYVDFLCRHPNPPHPAHPSTWLNERRWEVDYAAALDAALELDRKQRRNRGKETDDERLLRLQAEIDAETTTTEAVVRSADCPPKLEERRGKRPENNPHQGDSDAENLRTPAAAN